MIAIDQAHCDLIYGLIVSLKPRDVLEFGLGSGASATAIAKGLLFNDLKCSYTIVDNWHDWKGVEPGFHLEALEFPLPIIVNQDETEFCNTLEKDSYDFILSDADHANAEKNAGKLYYALRSPGIMIFHDVCNPGWPNLRVLKGSYANSVLFNKNSRDGEECDRGLLVVFR
jgi:predicted O-methyltransferase YrrM